MSPAFTLIYLTFAILISLLIGLHALRHRNSRGCLSFAVLVFVTIIWTVGDLISHLTDTYTGQWLAEVIRYLGGCALPVALLVFVYRYCGRQIGAKAVLLLSIVPLISWLMVVTNDFHHLMFKTAEVGYPNSLHVTFGEYFWVIHLPYLYGLMVVSLSKVILEIKRVSRNYRGQIILLFIALLIPFIANILAVSGVLGRGSYSPMSFPVAFLIITFGIFRFKLFGSNPIAYETVFHTIREGVIILDADDVIRDINLAAATRLGKKPDEIIGDGFAKTFAGSPEFVAIYEERKRQEEDIDTTIANSERFLSIDVTAMRDIDDSVLGRIVTLHDVTDRKQQQMSLETLAFHDPLTRLANRRKFQEEVELAMRNTWETGKHFSILYFDLNRFKVVNDTLGHEVGDELLKYVAARTASILRKPDLIARMGGDEFAVLLHDSDEKGVEAVVARMLANVERPFNVGEHTLNVGLSIGAAFYPADGKSLAQLLRHADSAMYRAKSQGGGLNLYSPGSEMEN